MELNQELKNDIIEIAAISFETGHFGFDSFELSAMLVEKYPEASKKENEELLKSVCQYYDELINLGPVGFYEEFKDVYDFDPMFVAEYGTYYDDEE